MKQYTMTMVPAKDASYEVTNIAESPADAVRKAEQQHPEMRAVDIEECGTEAVFASEIERCEACATPVFTEYGNGDYGYASEDGYFCTKCREDA